MSQVSTKKHLLDQMQQLQRRVAELEARERRHAEADEKLRHHELLFRAIMEHVPEGVVIVSAPDLKHLYSSREALRIIGQGLETIKDSKGCFPYNAVFHPDGTPVHTDDLPLVRAVHKGETVENQEVLVQRTNGTLVPLLCSAAPIYDENGTISGGVMSYVDITHRKQMEEQLRAGDEKFRSLFESMTEGFVLAQIMVDHNGRPFDYRVLEINPAAGRLTGLVPEAAVGRTARELVPSIEEGWIETFGKVALTGEPIRFERYAKAVGKWFDVVAFSPEKGRFAALFVDINDRKQMEEELLRIRERLEERIAERTAELRQSEAELRKLSSQLLRAQEDERKLIAMDLHDSIAASLAATKMKLERTMRDSEPGAEQLKPQIASAVALIEDTNTKVRRLMANLRPALLDELGLIAALNHQCRTFHELFPAITASVQADGEEADIPEPLKIIMFRIVEESLTNIGKHSTATEARIALRKEGESLLVEVRDNGRGFDVEAAHRHPRNGKTGFGLSSMRERARLSGGHFSVESAPGRGTTVRACWPQKARAQQADTAS